MLSATDNELLCRVGPGTPVGDVMRHYWIPAVRSEELPSPDCPPLRLRRSVVAANAATRGFARRRN